MGVGLLVVTICLDLCTTRSSSGHHHLRRPLSPKIQNGDILVPAITGPSGRMAVETEMENAPARRARETVEPMCRETLDLWHPQPKPLNSVDYQMWATMQECVYQTTSTALMN